MTKKILAAMSCSLPTATRYDPAWELGQPDPSSNPGDGSPRYGYWYPNVGAGSPMYQDADYLFTQDGTGGFVRTIQNHTYSSQFAAQLWRRDDQAGNRLPADIWIEWDIRFAGEILYDNDNGSGTFGFTNHMQLYRLSPGQEPFITMGAGRNVQNDAAMKWHVDLANRAVFDLPQLATPPIPIGAWVRMVAHVVLSADPDGVIDLWQDGVQIVGYDGPTIADEWTRYGVSVGNYGTLQGPAGPIVIDYRNVELSQRAQKMLSSRFTLRAYGLATDTTPSNDLGIGTPGSILVDQLTDFSLTDGAGVGAANVLFSDTRTLAASATEDLDLSGTALQDVLGANVALARIKGIYVAAAAGNTNNVVIGASASAQWSTLLNTTGTITLRPGDKFLAVSGPANTTGWPVTATTADLLKVANSSGGSSVSYDIVIIGANA